MFLRIWSDQKIVGRWGGWLGLYAKLIGFNFQWLIVPQKGWAPSQQTYSSCKNLFLFLNSVRQKYFSVTSLKSYLIQPSLIIFFLFWQIFVCTVPFTFFSYIVAHLFCFIHLLWISYFSSAFNGMALNSLHCAEVPLRNCSLSHFFWS